MIVSIDATGDDTLRNRLGADYPLLSSADIEMLLTHAEELRRMRMASSIGVYGPAEFALGFCAPLEAGERHVD